MLNQVQISYPYISNTIYIVIRDTTGKVWNGSTFEVWIDGNIGNYAEPCTYLGGNLYSADFPVDVPSGYYTIQIVIQDGVIPSSNDLPLDGTLGYWDKGEGNLVPVRVDTLIEYSQGERFTSKALEQVSGGDGVTIIERTPKVQVEASKGVDTTSIPAEIEVLPPGVQRESSAEISGNVQRKSSSKVGP